MRDELHDAEDHERDDAGAGPAVEDWADDCVDDDADDYTLNDIGLALRLRALAD